MNKQNIEIKYFCNDFEGIRHTLKEIGATHDITKKQKDYFFALPENKTKIGAKLKLRIEDGVIGDLIYYERPAMLGTGATADVLLLKASEESLNFYSNAFGVLGIVDKTRELWRLNNTVFHLDTVEHVGTLFEIELQKVDEVTAADRELFDTFLEKLTPHLDTPASGSNIDLVIEATS